MEQTQLAVVGRLVIAAIVLGTIVLLAVVWVASVYNRLATRRIRVRNGFSQIDVQLRRRHDLIPNLVSTVKGYMEHERSTLESVTQARAAAVSAQERVGGVPADAAATMALVQAEGLLQGALGRLMLLMERYPDIKANTNALALQEELVTTENRIAFARQAYNDAVMTYNTSLAVFPDNLIAGVFRFEAGTLFEADESARALPQVEIAGTPPRVP
ncbi:MAG: LemA family protein [Phycisphaerae bacterium]|nr:LemA family protein [Phycisphaerae bacterium]